MDKEANQLEELIKNALKKIPQGAVLAMSGGIDSGLLMALGKFEGVVNVCLPYGAKYNEGKFFNQLIALLGPKILYRVPLIDKQFEEKFAKAVKIIGRPIPHFNIFPLYEMYRVLAERGVKHVVLGDGPDESMCGYTRHLIMNYLYKIWNFEVFENYKPTISEILGPPVWQYLKLIGKSGLPLEERPSLVVNRPLIDSFCRADMELMRPDMHLMSDRLANHFGIKLHRPYEEKEVDGYMFNLPAHLKISSCGEYGKYLLRIVAAKYLPEQIAWKKHKVGGPVYPVNKIMGWVDTEGEFGKGKYLAWQRKILASPQS